MFRRRNCICQRHEAESQESTAASGEVKYVLVSVLFAETYWLPVLLNGLKDLFYRLLLTHFSFFLPLECPFWLIEEALDSSLKDLLDGGINYWTGKWKFGI